MSLTFRMRINKENTSLSSELSLLLCLRTLWLPSVIQSLLGPQDTRSFVYICLMKSGNNSRDPRILPHQIPLQFLVKVGKKISPAISGSSLINCPYKVYESHYGGRSRNLRVRPDYGCCLTTMHERDTENTPETSGHSGFPSPSNATSNTIKWSFEGNPDPPISFSVLLFVKNIILKNKPQMAITENELTVLYRTNPGFVSEFLGFWIC